MGAYLLVALVNAWLIYRCFKVWQLAQVADPLRLVTHYAQWQIVFCFTCSFFAFGLSLFMVLAYDWRPGWLSHWWGVYDILVALAFMSTLQFFEKSLSAGRKGNRDERVSGSAG